MRRQTGLFHRTNKPIAPFWYGFQEARPLGVIFENVADLPDGEVKPVFEINVGFRAPYLLRQFLARDDLSSVPHQNRQNPGRLRLKLQGQAVTAKLSDMAFEFVFAEN